MTFLKKILLVDYEPGIAALVRRALEATGAYQVKEERGSRLAFDTRWFQPDLILFDPAPSATDAMTRQLQDVPALRDTPVMFVRVDEGGNGGVVSGGVLSGYSFLANPVRLDELVRSVAELLHPAPVRNRHTRDALAV